MYGWSSQYPELGSVTIAAPPPSFVIMNASLIAIATPTKLIKFGFEVKKMGGTTVNLISFVHIRTQSHHTTPHLCAHQEQRSRIKVKVSIFSGWKSAKQYARRTIDNKLNSVRRCAVPSSGLHADLTAMMVARPMRVRTYIRL